MSSRIKLTFLGTSDSIPTARRNHPAILLSYDGEHILFDCGEGTQRQFRKLELNDGKITKIFITHWHGDHVLGLPGLLQTLSLTQHQKDLSLYGPKNTKYFMKKLFETFVFVDKFKLEINEVVKKGIIVNEKYFLIENELMTHGTPTNAYKFIKKGLLRIDKKKLEKAKISPGKHLQQLKEGKEITINGKKYKAKDLTYRDNDIIVSIVMDTKLNNKIIPFVKNSDVLIIESSFSDELKDKASEHLHLTSKQAGEIAKKANVKKLILTHISQRYEDKMDIILNETKKVFKNSHIAHDLDIVEV